MPLGRFKYLDKHTLSNIALKLYLVTESFVIASRIAGGISSPPAKSTTLTWQKIWMSKIDFFHFVLQCVRSLKLLDCDIKLFEV